MVETMEQSDGRVLRPRRRQRLHRKWDMDHRGGTSHDLTDRSFAQRLNQRFWPNYSKSQRDSITGNAYVEMLLVLPVLIAVFLGLATVTSLFLGKMAVSQAAEVGAQALVAGQSSSEVAQAVTDTLSQEGYQGTGVDTAETINGDSDTLRVSLPYTLWNTGTSTTISAVRTLTTMTGSSSSAGSSGGGGSGGGSGGYIYHHFPMW